MIEYPVQIYNFVAFAISFGCLGIVLAAVRNHRFDGDNRVLLGGAITGFILMFFFGAYAAYTEVQYFKDIELDILETECDSMKDIYYYYNDEEKFQKQILAEYIFDCLETRNPFFEGLVK